MIGAFVVHFLAIHPFQDGNGRLSRVLTSLKKQKDVLLGKIEREQLLEKLAPLEEKMLAIVRERGRITIADAVTLLAANRNTVKLHLRQLVQQGYLEQHGAGKGTWYSMGR